MIFGPMLVAIVLTVPPAVQEDRMWEHAKREAWRRSHAPRRHRRIRHRLSPLNTRAAAAALSYLGVPYVYGGEGPGGFDCSGLVQYAYAKVGKYIPRTTWTQELIGRAVSFGSLQPGDLVFAEGGGHVGMYVGGGNVVNAPYTGTVVQTTPLADFGGEWVRRP